MSGTVKPLAPAEAPVDYEDAYQKFLDFLSSPIWVLPVMTFLEQRSLVFDNEQPKENAAFKQVHQEYRNLIDTLIQGFCDDAHISVKGLVETLKNCKIVRKGSEAMSKDTSMPADYSALEPVLAASDYDLFIHMMIKKNIDLQLQALQMIEVMCGVLPDTMANMNELEKAAGNLNRDDQEKLILMQVIKQSLVDFEKDRKIDDTENAATQRALQESLREKKRLEIEQRREESLIRAALKISLDEKVTMKEFLTDSNLAKQRKSTKDEDQQQNDSATTVSYERLKENEPETKELQARRQHLIEQRDKLLALKKTARERALENIMQSGAAFISKRPRTAKIARSAMAAASLKSGGRNINVDRNDGSDQSSDRFIDLSSTPNHEVIAARRELMQKIKREVIGFETDK